MGVVLKLITRPVILLGAFGLGLGVFMRPWPIVPLSKRPMPLKLTDLNVYEDLQTNQEFKQISTDKDFKIIGFEDFMSSAHKVNHVGQGIFNTPNHLDVGPLIFLNKKTTEMIAYIKLGKGLVGNDGKIHNGIISTLLDECLCLAGFSKLPSKRGVTASLNIDYQNKANPNSVVILKANVDNSKGRKCFINGDIRDLKTGEKIANARCLLVEPKWFKYLSWV